MAESIRRATSALFRAKSGENQGILDSTRYMPNSPDFSPAETEERSRPSSRLEMDEADKQPAFAHSINRRTKQLETCRL